MGDGSVKKDLDDGVEFECLACEPVQAPPYRVFVIHSIEQTGNVSTIWAWDMFKEDLQ